MKNKMSKRELTVKSIVESISKEKDKTPDLDIGVFARTNEVTPKAPSSKKLFGFNEDGALVEAHSQSEIQDSFFIIQHCAPKEQLRAA